MSVDQEQKPGRETVILMPVFTAKPGFGARLEEELASLQLLSRNDEGCIAYSVFVDRAAPERFVLYEEWTTRQALADHNEKDHARSFFALSDEWLAGPFGVSELRPVEPRGETRP
ncbi:putative quinol monooxygenase [Cryobacterium sp. HLT2-28]|uniref:putative quinol monooxygenase n=1 Tax=Cryobacterium sp. HLT2-28 TaxID=1259146 RepID=UPI00141B9D25|nr:putative quinol monooxygenase [Cryobacterium sp. HLT2-28]